MSNSSPKILDNTFSETMGSDLNIVFFGTDQDVSVTVLESLVSDGFTPNIIVTQPDRPSGRKLKLTPCPVKVWADERDILTMQPEKLTDETVGELEAALRAASDNPDAPTLFIVASYGLIIPQSILDIPTLGTLNVHPSLLPKYRGATPAESAMLNDDKKTGTTIILMDHKMDHGPIVAQETYTFEEWPTKPEVLRRLASLGGTLLTTSIKNILNNTATYTDQNHSEATFTKMISKSDGEINFDDNPRTNFLKTQAYTPWPGTFFFKDSKRIKITEATWENDNFILKKVIPEGKKEVDWKVFLHNKKD